MGTIIKVKLPDDTIVDIHDGRISDADIARWNSGGGVSDHSLLDNLDYANSGHTGFQEEIEDLDDIRAGAEAGATALQEVPNTYRTSAAQDTIDDAIKGRLDTIEGKESGWDAKYTKPSAGIPKTDLASGVKTSLGKADTSLQPSDIVDDLESLDSDKPISARAVNVDLVDFIDGSISDTMNYIRQEIGDENAGRVAGDNILSERITAIEGKIPSEASSINKLADKAFVNSSITTNTAFFRGTWDLVEDLGLTKDATEEQIAAALATAITTVTNNDYSFVFYNDPTAGIAEYYDRYKYSTEDGWGFEYRLNNSSFTAAQWATINSGLTSTDKTALDNALTLIADFGDIVTHNASEFLTEHQSLAAYRTASAQDAIDATKVDKVTDKGLSTNDYTTEEKDKLAGLENYDDTEVKADITALESGKADKLEIPTKTSDLTNDSGFIDDAPDDGNDYLRSGKAWKQFTGGGGGSVAMEISALTSNPSSIALDSSAKRTYQTCTITTRTSITLSGGNANAGYEHYILFQNTSSSKDCTITKASTMKGPALITVPHGKYLELSYIYTGTNVIITNSAVIQ